MCLDGISVRRIYPFFFNQLHQRVVRGPPGLGLSTPEIRLRRQLAGQQVLLRQALELLQRLEHVGRCDVEHWSPPPFSELEDDRRFRHSLSCIISRSVRRILVGLSDRRRCFPLSIASLEGLGLCGRALHAL